MPPSKSPGAQSRYKVPLSSNFRSPQCVNLLLPRVPSHGFTSIRLCRLNNLFRRTKRAVRPNARFLGETRQLRKYERHQTLLRTKVVTHGSGYAVVLFFISHYIYLSEKIKTVITSPNTRDEYYKTKGRAKGLNLREYSVYNTLRADVN